jgi:UDP-N-acetylmuramoyl-L-alanyl-D-glutamate--2,6-diaminopimelate ligase
VPYLQVPDSRLAVARLSAARYGYPHNRHIMTGITGTNGKTTTAYMLRHILESTQRSCSLFGTVER